MAKAPAMPEPMMIPMPFSGYSIDSSLYMQPKGTTPQALNVVPQDWISGKRRISRRPGLAKFLDEQVVAASIQDITSVSVAYNVIEGTGDFMSHGATSDRYLVYDGSTQADATPDTNYTSASVNALSMGCTDEDNNFYVCTLTGKTFTLFKVGTDNTTKWTVTMTLTGSGDASIFGLAAYNGTLYLYAIAASASSIDSPGIYRFSTASGGRLDSGTFLAPTTLAYVTTLTVAYQGMACAAGLLGVVGSTASGAGNLVLQLFNASTGSLLYQTTLEAFSSYPCKVVTDRGANFYILVNIASGTKKIYKINSVGAVPSGYTAPTVANAADIAYDPVNYQLGVVCTASNSFRRYNATTGAVEHAGYDPATFTAFHAIACDGLVSGAYFYLRRSVAAGNVDIVKVAATATSYAIVWGANLQSSLGVISDTLWMVCSGLNTAPVGSSMQSTRATRFLTVANGALYSIDGLDDPDGDLDVSNITSTFVNVAEPVVFSTVNNLTVFYVDGYSYKTYNFSTATAGSLTASAGSLPSDENGWKCRLICTWRNRIVMAGLRSDPTNWFMSAVGDSTDWDYEPATESVTQAIAGNIAEAGKVPEIITALIPHTDNMLIFGCEGAIYRLTGDPADFGRMDLVSDETGMAWGRAFCKDPAGVIYFFGSRGGIWRMGAADTPQRISTPIDSELNAIDLETHLVRLAWDDDFEGIWIIVSPLDATQDTRWYWWDSETPRRTSYEVIKTPGSWWPIEFANKNHNALAVHVLDSDNPNHRVVLFGGRDGYIRFFDPEAKLDDGYEITSELFIGPVHMKEGGLFRIVDLQCTLAADSKPVNWAVYSGECIETALNVDPDDVQFSGTFSVVDGKGRNRSQAIRAGQHAAFIVLSSDDEQMRWSVEQMMAMIQPMPMGVAQRAF